MTQPVPTDIFGRRSFTPFNAAHVSVHLRELDDFARRLIEGWPTPRVIGIDGTLGAGKTTLVRSIAAAVGVDPADVTSPTFTIMNVYPVTDRRPLKRIHHIDAYRLDGPEDWDGFGGSHWAERPDAWTIVEWSDRVAEVLPADRVRIRIDVVDPTTRRIEVIDGNLTDRDAASPREG